MTRRRSEHRLARASDAAALDGSTPPTTMLRPVRVTDRDALATTVLDAYRGTVDDEGEGDDEARAAIDEWFARIEWSHSFVIEQDEQLVALCFVIRLGGRHYIDPIATIASAKRQGYGRSAALAALRSLAAAGVQEVGAVITDGNVPSERLFTALGFVRVGDWS